MKVYFVRHGETEFNLKKILMGQRYDLDLNRKGVEQAKALAEIVPTEVNIIFSSPLKRAFHTAMIIATKLGLSITSRDELEERDYGSLSGMTWDEIEKKTGFSLEHIESHIGKVDLSKYGAESASVIRLRLMHFLADLKKNHHDRVPLVVAHSGIIRLMYEMYPNTPRQDVKNASLHVFEI